MVRAVCFRCLSTPGHTPSGCDLTRHRLPWLNPATYPDPHLTGVTFHLTGGGRAHGPHAGVMRKCGQIDRANLGNKGHGGRAVPLANGENRGPRDIPTGRKFMCRHNPLTRGLDVARSASDVAEFTVNKSPYYSRTHTRI